MEKFKEGQKVSHQLHGYGIVIDVDEDRNLVQVRLAAGKCVAVHPVSLTKLPMPKFEVRIEWEGGSVSLSGPLYEDAVSLYIASMTNHLYRATRITVDRLRPPVTKNS